MGLVVMCIAYALDIEKLIGKPIGGHLHGFMRESVKD